MNEFAVDLTRHIAAPRARVYRALLEPALLVRWMYPAEGCLPGDAEVDERRGGRHRIEYLAPDGRRHVFESTILELVQDERVVLDFAFQGPDADMSEPDTVLTLTLADAPGGGTLLRLVHERVTLGPQLTPESVDAGWAAVLDRLETLWTTTGEPA